MLAPQISIELDPRYTSREQLQILKKHNVHTLSFGIQDLNSKVLANVNREQNIDEILSLLNYAHSLGFPHINIDLIYGLTHQTPETLSATLEILQQIRADSIALYPFAKVPWQNNSQKAFGDFKDYSRIEMNELFAAADIFLHQMGFTHIGMGHFARNESSFLTLFKKKKLKRNIMGFTEKKSNMLIGLGVSAFSSGITGHVQNEKVLEQYIFALQKDRPPLYKSHAVTSDQLILTAMFEKIICENYFDETDRMKILPEQENNFKLYLQNNFIEHTGDTYSITDQGRYFLKNICQCWG
jgi:oxygen-independent coproporphyrinogen-3 oxidase